ncbi:MAG: hypothetical protein FWG30_00145 [Eubacteriaceae bacterium]|nr:hypothetical protein [Eubacteriaceae bacterium]
MADSLNYNSASKEPEWEIHEEASSLAELLSVLEGEQDAPIEIELASDIVLDGEAIQIPSGKVVKIRSKSKCSYKLTARKRSRVLEVKPGAKLYLENVTIANGKSAQGGGAIYSQGRLALLKGAQVTASYSQQGGGGIYNDGATLAIAGGRVNKNTALTEGGGIYNDDGLFVMVAGSIDENTAEDGGGVYSQLEGKKSHFAILGKSHVSRNRAKGSGGGLMLVGSESSDDTVFNIMDSAEVSNNEAEVGAGASISFGKLRMRRAKMAANAAAEAGGAIFADTDAELEIENSEITDNSAANGGGIYRSDGYAIIHSSRVHGNRASQNGGGIYSRPGNGAQIVIEGDTELSSNRAGGDGGAIWISKNHRHLLDIDEQAVFSDNNASTASAISSEDAQEYEYHVLTDDVTAPFDNAYNNADISYKGEAAFALFKANLQLIGKEAPDDEFRFGVFSDLGELVCEAMASGNGLVEFWVSIAQSRSNEYTLRMLSAPEGWTVDTVSYPAAVELEAQADGQAAVDVIYPDGLPIFKSSNMDDAIGIFAELTFTKPGRYEYLVKPVKIKDRRWASSREAYPIIIDVVDAGLGYLAATISYPDGYPAFINTFTEFEPVKVSLSASCIANVDSQVFEYGLYSLDGELVSLVTVNQQHEPDVQFGDGTYEADAEAEEAEIELAIEAEDEANDEEICAKEDEEEAAVVLEVAEDVEEAEAEDEAAEEIADEPEDAEAEADEAVEEAAEEPEEAEANEAADESEEAEAEADEAVVEAADESEEAEAEAEADEAVEEAIADEPEEAEAEAAEEAVDEADEEPEEAEAEAEADEAVEEIADESEEAEAEADEAVDEAADEPEDAEAEAEDAAEKLETEPALDEVAASDEIEIEDDLDEADTEDGQAGAEPEAANAEPDEVSEPEAPEDGEPADEQDAPEIEDEAPADAQADDDGYSEWFEDAGAAIDLEDAPEDIILTDEELEALLYKGFDNEEEIDAQIPSEWFDPDVDNIDIDDAPEDIF